MIEKLVRLLVVALIASAAWPVEAQVTPAAGSVPPDDTPSVRVGGTLFLDYTFTDAPKTTDADGNQVSQNAFNVGRAYLNITGQINHLVAFRITPDITRESGTGSSLNGSLTYRLKYGYAQLNLDDWMWRGSYVRVGMIPTPVVNFEEDIYRYRFQGTVFADREGFLSSADFGVMYRTQFPNAYGEVMAASTTARPTRGPRPTTRRRSRSGPRCVRCPGRAPSAGCGSRCFTTGITM